MRIPIQVRQKFLKLAECRSWYAESSSTMHSTSYLTRAHVHFELPDVFADPSRKVVLLFTMTIKPLVPAFAMAKENLADMH